MATSRSEVSKILVANRGEIAVRVIRGAAEMGIPTVAVYSDADRAAMHVRFAHEAYHIGEPESAKSYLDIDKILDVASRAKADAIHPGYGFLSENATFARACRERGITFIGPPPEAMEAVGDKVRARELMQKAGVPVVPGTPPLSGDTKEVAKQAKAIGYPVLLKAAAGGGGKGMRVVRSEKELPSLLDQARGEARSSFGDARVFLEKFVERPRHIEVQVLADKHGKTLHLGERDCSIQRRHQKLIEESPSPVVDEAEREKIGALAVRAVEAAGYESAGTVEFLRGDDGSFYFMEVNARLQVEHPVTEMVTGIDLVKEMIRVARNEPLAFDQKDVALRGHAIECRIIAEDPTRNFMPAPGLIRGERIPAGPGIRYDGGTYAGYTVPIFYDPLVGKLVTHGKDRDEAVARMRRALDELRIDGLRTSIEFHRQVMDEPDFRAGRLHTGYLEDHPELTAPAKNERLDEIAVVAAAVAHSRAMEAKALEMPATSSASGSRWKHYDRARGWKA